MNSDNISYNEILHVLDIMKIYECTAMKFAKCSFEYLGLCNNEPIIILHFLFMAMFIEFMQIVSSSE